MTPVRRYKFLVLALAVCVAGAVAPRTVQAEIVPNLAVLPMFAHSHKKTTKTTAETAKTTASKTTAKKTKSHWTSSKETAKNSAAKSGSSMKTEEHGKTEARTEAKAGTHSNMMGQKPPAAGMVWVNTSSKVYHKSGSKFYGKTKQGKWMTESEAQKAGYRAAKN